MLNQPAFWYRHPLHPLALLLWPISQLFSLGVAIRRYLYRIGLRQTHHFKTPVIVVGNMTVGGTGKTPFVIWLAQFLKSQGYHPGIVSRGVGGKKHSVPYQVRETDTAETVGDEALLLLKHTRCPIIISIHRADAVRYLLTHEACDVVISDDGLQHYRLGRQIEIVMIDGEREWGNRYLLPAGPLREPISRTRSVDFLIRNGGQKDKKDKEDHLTYSMTVEPYQLVSVKHPNQTIPFSQLLSKKVHAVAGIGHPEKFFSSLKQAGIDIIPHVFSDHYLYQANDFHFDASYPILMTEKDAVKCKNFAKDHYWYVTTKTKVDAFFEKELLSKLNPKLRS